MLVGLTSTTGQAHAQGEHGRRAGAELRVLTGDIRKLIAADAADAQKPNQLLRHGLVDRVRGSLSALDILLRMANQEAGKPALSYTALVQGAINLTDARQWNRLNELLIPVEAQFPLISPNLSKPESLLQSSQDLHQRLCAACHDNPQQPIKRPAYNLFEQAKSQSASEFFARMLIGVRGDRITGIDNPFTDAALAGLIYFYKTGRVD